jgi:hypothetical protein
MVRNDAMKGWNLERKKAPIDTAIPETCCCEQANGPCVVGEDWGEPIKTNIDGRWPS